MRIRQTAEYEVMCRGCGSLLRVGFGELRFEGRDDQRIPCPACGTRVLVIQGGMIADGVEPKLRDGAWRQVENERPGSEGQGSPGL